MSEKKYTSVLSIPNGITAFIDGEWKTLDFGGETMRDPQNFFTGEDCFELVKEGDYDGIRSQPDEIMLAIPLEKANALIREALGPKVVCRLDDGKWACDEHPGFARATHSGSLFCVREIEKS